MDVHPPKYSKIGFDTSPYHVYPSVSNPTIDRSRKSLSPSLRGFIFFNERTSPVIPEGAAKARYFSFLDSGGISCDQSRLPPSYIYIYVCVYIYIDIYTIIHIYYNYEV